MKRFVAFGIAALATLTLLVGCATILGGGPQQKITFNADQPKVNYLIKDQTGSVVFDGTDPGTLSLAKKNTYTVEVSLAGYAKQTITISQGINGWFWGNLCIGGIIGMGIDFITGSMWDLQPSNLNIKMHMASAKTDNGFVVTFVTRDDSGNLRSMDLTLTKL